MKPDALPSICFSSHRMWLLAVLLVCLPALYGCGIPAPPLSPDATGLPPPPLAAPTQTPFVIIVTATTAAATATSTPSLPPPPLPTAGPPATAAPTHPATLRLQMYLIAVGDNGVSGKPVGCGDSLVPVAIDVPYTQGVLRAALERLLAHEDRSFGESGLYHALYQSNLKVDGINIKDGQATVHLSGQVILGGECDTPRVIAQLEETALQFDTVDRVTIQLNGVPIRDALSLR